MRIARIAVAAITALTAGAGGAAAQNQCGGLIQAACLQSLGAGSTPLPDSDCGKQLAEYRTCLAGVASAAGGPARTSGPGCSEAQTARLWASAEASNSCVAYRGFRDACPSTPEARFAEAKLEELGCPQAESAAAPAAPSRPAAPAARAGEGGAAPPPLAALPSFDERLREAAQGVALKECDVCPEIVAIPGGSFTMGAAAENAQPGAHNRPQRTVRVAPFAIGITEISYAEYVVCVREGGCRDQTINNSLERGDHPAIYLGWHDAQSYVRWLNRKVPGTPYRLPSEAEWEYAARAGSTTNFWWGSLITPTYHPNFVRRAQYEKEPEKRAAKPQTMPVKTLRRNRFGLYHVHGNVAEWTQDCWNDDYEGAPTDGSPWMSGDCLKSPTRGGSYKDEPMEVRSAYRKVSIRGLRFDGLRVARSLAP